MPATMPRGWPYPLDTDPIDVAADIEAIAARLQNENFVWRLGSAPGSATTWGLYLNTYAVTTNGAGFASINLSAAGFAGKPAFIHVVASAGTGSGDPSQWIVVASATLTSSAASVDVQFALFGPASQVQNTVVEVLLMAIGGIA